MQSVDPMSLMFPSPPADLPTNATGRETTSTPEPALCAAYPSLLKRLFAHEAGKQLCMDSHPRTALRVHLHHLHLHTSLARQPALPCRAHVLYELLVICCLVIKKLTGLGFLSSHDSSAGQEAGFINIEEGQLGKNFEAIFTPYIAGSQEIWVKDPNLVHTHQVLAALPLCSGL